MKNIVEAIIHKCAIFLALPKVNKADINKTVRNAQNWCYFVYLKIILIIDDKFLEYLNTLGLVLLKILF